MPIMFCYRHPREETVVSCGKCDRPICTKCMIAGPAGMRCPDCSALKSTHLYKVAPHRLLLTIAAALLTGIIGAQIVSFAGFFVFFLGPAYGYAVSYAVLWASGQKRGRTIEMIGVGGIVAGAGFIAVQTANRIAAMTASHIASAGGGPVDTTVIVNGVLMQEIWPLVGCVIAGSVCYARLR